MKYTPEITKKLIEDYEKDPTSENVERLANELDVPIRSIIAKLSSEGIYKKKEYLDKQGNIPVKKEEYIDRIALALGVNAEILESLEKVNKNVLKLIDSALNAKNVE